MWSALCILKVQWDNFMREMESRLSLFWSSGRFCSKFAEIKRNSFNDLFHHLIVTLYCAFTCFVYFRRVEKISSPKQSIEYLSIYPVCLEAVPTPFDSGDLWVTYSCLDFNVEMLTKLWKSLYLKFNRCLNQSWSSVTFVE